MFSGWMNKALDFVCGRIGWPCEMPEYSQKSEYPQKQVEPLRAVPQQTVHQRNQENSENSMVISQYHSEIRPGAQYSNEPKVVHSGQASGCSSGQTSQMGQSSGQIEPGHPVLSGHSRHSGQSVQSAHSSHSSQGGPRAQTGQTGIESHISQLSMSNRPVTINTGYNQPAPTTVSNSLLTEIRTGASLRPVNQNGPQPRGQPTGPNFNDELKRRLADRQGRKTDSPAEPEKNNRVDSSDYSSEPSPDVAEKSQKMAAGQVEEIRRAIRGELSQFKAELFSQFRDVIRSEIRNLQADSNH